MNDSYHESVLYTVSVPWAFRITIRSIVGHISTMVTESNLELQMVKLPAMVSSDQTFLSMKAKSLHKDFNPGEETLQQLPHSVK